MKIAIGVDVGNYDTKTQNTVTPSSYRSSEMENKLNSESLFYNGIYYMPTMERNNQQLDKTINNYCIIMALFGIAKQTIWQIEHNFHEENDPDACITDEEMQKRIREIDKVILGVGLPVGHFSSLAKKTVDCYNEVLGSGFSFVYRGFEFQMKLVKCVAYPQDLTAVLYNNDVEIARDFDAYYICGIGGGTADIIPVIDGEPQIEKCKSLEMGTTIMYEYIATTIQHESGNMMEYSIIETILLDKPSIIDEKRKTRVKELAKEFVDRLVAEFVHVGLKLSDYPCVFVGGGALMMKKNLQSNPLFAKTEFVTDVNANAKYYALFAEE